MATTFERIQLNRKTAAQWTAGNIVLLAGEAGVETDTHKVKFGDGTTAWNGLPYAGDTTLKADYPTGGVDGQALIKSGATTAWATITGGSGSGGGVTDNGDGTVTVTAISGAAGSAEVAYDTDGTPYLPALVPTAPSGTTTNSSRNLGHTFWTTPLTSSAPLASSSTSMVSRLVAQFGAVPGGTPLEGWYAAPYQTITNQDAYSLPIYRVPDNAPRVPVWSRRDKGTLRTVLQAGVPVPDPSLLPNQRIGAAGSDSSCIIIQGNTAWEFWQFGPAETGTDPGGYAWKCEQGGVIADIRTHPGIWSGSSFFGGGTGGRPTGYDWGVSAAGFSYLGLLLKWEDWAAADILHPIALTLQLTGGAGGEPYRVLPATRNDSGNLTKTPDATADAYRVPEAAKFRLPAGFDIPGWVSSHAVTTAGATGATATVLTKILRCIRDFGMYVIDTGGVTAFSAEASSTFGTPYNTLSTTAPNWGNFGQQVPWSSLQQLAVPATDISIPAEA